MEKRESNIVLIGITGVGKTTIGKLLAEKLHREFIDLDKKIELRCGVDIPTIFEIEGEERFRQRETEELQSIVGTFQRYVLSVGGGCTIRSQNRRLLSSGANIVIQLYAEIDSLVERLERYSLRRPLLSNVNVKDKITDLYTRRKDDYDQITDFKINTSVLKPLQVVESIIKFIRS